MYSALVSQKEPADGSVNPVPPFLPRKVKFWNTWPSSCARPQEPGCAAPGATFITPTLLSADPPVAQASSAVLFHVRVMITSTLYCAITPASGVNFIVFT